MKFLTVLASAALVVAACGDDTGRGEAGGGGGETQAAGFRSPTTTSPDDTGTTAAEGTAAPDGTTAATDGTTAATSGDSTAGTATGDTTEGSAPAGAGAEIGGSACGIPHGPYDERTEEPSGEVRAAWNDPLYSFNSNTNRGNATAINNVLYLMNAGGFSYYDADLQLVNNDQFGTCTLDSLDPLTITYTINEGVTWSDGTPVDAADLLLHWAGQSTVFNTAETTTTADGQIAAADENGQAIVLGSDGAEITSADADAYGAAFDPDTGALLEGYTYKESTGVAFDAVLPGLQLVTQFPEISEDGRSITTVFDSFYVDYTTGGLSSGTPVPAHTVGRLALGVEDPMEAKQAVIDALRADFDSDDPAQSEPVRKIAETWNTGFDTDALPDDPGLYLSYGPYVLTAYEELSEMTLELNPDYTWGPQPHVSTIVWRIIGDPTAAVQAMENEEIDIIQPQATADILTQLEALADRGVEVQGGDGATYEHFDLVFDNDGVSPFDPAHWDGNEETALAVRQAFLKTLPRQEIVERLIVPLNPEAQVRNAFDAVPGSPDYDERVANNGSDAYAEQDIDGAKQLLADAGVDTTTPIDVRLLFADNNPRRASEYELIRDAAAQAGFNVIDGRSATWVADSQNSSLFDAWFAGWQSTSIAVTSSEAQYVTDGANNRGGYSSPEVDALYERLQTTTDPAEQQAIMIEVEQNLIADAFGLPIFQHPEITAYNSTYVSGVDSIALAPTVLYNFWDWEAAG